MFSRKEFDESSVVKTESVFCCVAVSHVAVCCSVLQCVAVSHADCCERFIRDVDMRFVQRLYHCIAVCCSDL